MLQRFAFSSMRRSAPSWLTPCCSSAVSSPSWMPSTQPPTILSQQSQTTTIRPRSSRSQRGLYDGKDVRFGNNVPFSMKKTRRRWNPNLQKKKVYSEILDEMIPFHLTTSALRSIDKYGGLDEYLLRSKHVSTKGEGEGQRIRNRVVQTMKHREELKRQAIENGESVEDWDKIVLVGKKIKQTSSSASMEE
mmetsp:Transcript_8382/g.18778  ORF Transcript_8382/g.18778 Transcript_8382/m.18778 type:complete len:191 (+) Transcript_8382:148-720(+)|eukprot:CAMPEP_0172309904 /NCGR_PEP_ID=MMETSP1058-20130122/10891_1 /TAXON_ID=83371 /ORGANISM="Detonula confervacea, Strain CCMP 353" /LENGTH=190 /DNA_ID=CAMNT_0013022617 /DNA_START=88 /DNA_END=660 /DNA_ORIENTATION=-